MNFNYLDYFGLFGSFLIAYLYFYGQYKHSFLTTKFFYFGNILGSALIINSLILSSFNLASFFIESLWISISFYGLYKYNFKNITTYEEIISYHSDEITIDEQPTIITPRYFDNKDINIEIKCYTPNNDIVFEEAYTMVSFSCNGTSCDDNNATTTGETWLDNVCQGGTIVNGTSCDDNNNLTVGETYLNGICQGGNGESSFEILSASLYNSSFASKLFDKDLLLGNHTNRAVYWNNNYNYLTLKVNNSFRI